MKRALPVLLAASGVLWPFAVYFSLGKVALIWLLLPLAALWLLRALSQAGGFAARAVALGMAAFLLLLAALDGFFAVDAQLALRAYPVLINALLLGVFAHSLLSGMPLIERIARLRQPNLPEEGVRYTRKVTQVWCLFFAANGSTAALLALFASWQAWTLYNGCISYLLMGALFLAEWCVRPKAGRQVPS